VSPHGEHLVGYLVDRLGESSTIRGVVGVATVILGVTVDRDHLEAYLAATVGLSAALKILLPDRFFDYPHRKETEK
jgi:hypothetical protein